jgi:hypothetical protein
MPSGSRTTSAKIIFLLDHSGPLLRHSGPGPECRGPNDWARMTSTRALDIEYDIIATIYCNQHLHPNFSYLLNHVFVCQSNSGQLNNSGIESKKAIMSS